MGEFGAKVGDAAARQTAKTRGQTGNVTSMNYALAMRCLAPVTLLLVGALVSSAATATQPARHGHEHEHAQGKAARRLTPLHFTCADALDDGTLLDGRQASELTRLARTLTWPELGPPPPLPARDVRLFCGPDVDGDGERDAIVRLAFDNPDTNESAIDAEQLSYTFLASKHGVAWRALGRLSADVTGDRDVEQSVVFVRRPTGQYAIEIERSSFASETGCRITGYELIGWRAGALATVEAGDRSPKCAPCGCDNK